MVASNAITHSRPAKASLSTPAISGKFGLDPAFRNMLIAVVSVANQILLSAWNLVLLEEMLLG